MLNYQKYNWKDVILPIIAELLIFLYIKNMLNNCDWPLLEWAYFLCNKICHKKIYFLFRTRWSLQECKSIQIILPEHSYIQTLTQNTNNFDKSFIHIKVENQNVNALCIQHFHDFNNEFNYHTMHLKTRDNILIYLLNHHH